MKKILLHTIFPDCLNGPNSVNKMIRDSWVLKESYQIEDVNQTILPGKNPIKFVKLVFSMKKEIERKKADAIIVTGLQFAGFCCTLAAKLARINKIIVCVHGYSGDAKNISSTMRFLYNRIIEPATIYLCDSIYTVCDFGANRPMMKKYSKGKLYGTIHNCFPDPICLPQAGFRRKEGIADDAIVITNVGRVVEDKGHKEIIDIIKRDYGEKAIFVIVGDGSYIDNYRAECHDLIAQRKLLLLGQREDVLDILLESDIFIFPTYHENLSMALLEACYSQCAIIATNVDGNPEVIKNRENGLLIEARNSNELYSAIIELINDENERILLSEKAHSMLKVEFSYNTFQNRMKAMLDTVVDGD